MGKGRSNEEMAEQVEGAREVVRAVSSFFDWSTPAMRAVVLGRKRHTDPEPYESKATLLVKIVLDKYHRLCIMHNIYHKNLVENGHPREEFAKKP